MSVLHSSEAVVYHVGMFLCVGGCCILLASSVWDDRQNFDITSHVLFSV